MSKIVPVKDIGVPVPAEAPPNTSQLVCYFGPKNFVPNYDQAARIALPLSSLAVVLFNGVSYYKFPLSNVLPANVPDGEVDFYFTLLEASGSEGDFSPGVTETVDRTPPLALGQPVVLP